jgi:hypothetical protein
LSGFAHEQVCGEGVAIDSLAPGTVVAVSTRNSQYRLVVVDGASREVLVQGGTKFPQAVWAVMQGSSAGGAIVKAGWICVGLQMELFVDARCVLTSPVSAVAIEDPGGSPGYPAPRHRRL